MAGWETLIFIITRKLHTNMAGKDDCNKLVTIKVDDEKIREIIKKTVKEVIANRAAHTRIILDNHDYTWHTAEWWYDIKMTQRYGMPATEATVTYDSNTNTVHISANFPIQKQV